MLTIVPEEITEYPPIVEPVKPELIALFKLDACDPDAAETLPETLLEPLTIDYIIIAF